MNLNMILSIYNTWSYQVRWIDFRSPLFSCVLENFNVPKSSENCARWNWSRRPYALIGSLRYGDYGLRTTAGRALSFVRSTGLSRANIERY